MGAHGAPSGHLGDPVEDIVDDAVGDLAGAVDQPHVEHPLDVAVLRHACVPPTATDRSSASRAARMARYA